MKDLNEILFNKPLYPNEQPFERKDEQKQSFSPLNSLLGENLNIQSIMPLLLGMKNGNSMDMLSNMLSKNMKDNPLFKLLSSQSMTNKKESDSSLQTIPDEEIY